MRDGTNDTMDGLLAFHAIRHLGIRHAAMTRSNTVQGVEGRWDTNRATFSMMSLEYGIKLSERLTNISPYSHHAASNPNHRSLAPRASTARPVLVAGVESSANDVVNRLADHERLRNTRFGIENSTGLAEESRENGLCFVVFSQPVNITHGCFDSLCRCFSTLDIIYSRPGASCLVPSHVAGPSGK